MKISIDFVGGTHGNFLEFILNKLLLGNDVISDKDVFNDIGASHKKSNLYANSRVVEAKHFYKDPGILTDNVISIRFEKDELLKVTSLMFYRSQNLKIDDNFLHIDTYRKLNYENKSIIEILKQAYGIELSEENTDCSRYILREFFKLAFKNHDTNGHMRMQQDLMVYSSNKKVFHFPFKSFYNIDDLKSKLIEIKDFFNLNYVIELDELNNLHKEFLIKLGQYLYIKEQADSIVDDVKNKIHRPIQELTLLQESYINSELENLFGIEMPFNQEKYFQSTTDIIEHLKL